jgi:hypothetical protein
MSPLTPAGPVAALPIVSPLDAGLGGLFASIGLVYLLGYLNLLDAADASETLERTLIALLLPLFLVFAGIVVDRSLAILFAGA